MRSVIRPARVSNRTESAHLDLPLVAGALPATVTGAGGYATAGAAVTGAAALARTAALVPWLRPDRLPPRPEAALAEIDAWLGDHRPQTVLPVICVPEEAHLRQMDLSSIRVALYPTNAVRNIHLLRVPTMKHVFIGHGDSGESADVNSFSKVYDEAWTAGPAGRKRCRLAAVGVRDADIVEVGRPQLTAVQSRDEAKASRVSGEGRVHTAARAATLLTPEASQIGELLEATAPDGADPFAADRQELKEYLFGPGRPGSLDRFDAAIRRLVAASGRRDRTADDVFAMDRG